MPKTNDIKFYMNILPLIIIFLLIGGAGYFLFGQDIKFPSKEDNITKITRIDDFPYRISVSEDRKKDKAIITSEQELTEFMTKVDPEGLITLRGEFNFNKNILVAASSESLNGKLNRYKIKRVVKDAERKELTIERELITAMEECPEKTSEEEEAKKSIFVDLIQLNKTDWEIDFDLIKKELPCGEF